MLLLQGLKIGCKVLTVLLLARLVPPADHGVFAMAASVFLLLALFRDAGLGAAAVRAASLDDAQLNALFWAHLTLGVVLALATISIAPLIAQFYRNPAVQPVLFSMSGAFLLIGAGGFARTQLERAVRFAEVSGIEGIAAVTGTMATIAAGAAGAGAYSFVAYLLISEAVATLLAWRAWSWRPKGAPRWSSLRVLVRTGADVTTYQVIVHLVQQIDGIVIGRLFGAHSLGLYNRSNQLLSLPQLHIAAPLNQVAMATLSRIGSKSCNFIEHARHTATAIAHLVLPLFAVCIVLPDETVRLVLGRQWPDAAPLLRFLAIAAASTTITSLAYAINVAAGETRRLVQSVVFALPLTLAAVWLGSRYGTLGVAQSIAAVNGALMLPRLWWALRTQPGGLLHYWKALGGPLVAMSAFSLGMWLGQIFLPETQAMIRFPVAIATGILALLITAAVWPRLRNEWRTVKDYLPLPGRSRP